jgi:hypothetical protein
LTNVKCVRYNFYTSITEYTRKSPFHDIILTIQKPVSPASISSENQSKPLPVNGPLKVTKHFSHQPLVVNEMFRSSSERFCRLNKVACLEIIPAVFDHQPELLTGGFKMKLQAQQIVLIKKDLAGISRFN